MPRALIEFPADDLGRARAFWEGLLEVSLEERDAGEGQGRQARVPVEMVLGLHDRGKGPGDTRGLAYFLVDDLAAALQRVTRLGGELVHPGERWAICRDSEGSPFGLGAATR